MNIGSELTRGPIVAGTDFSQASLSALNYAAILAISESRPLHLVHAMSLLPEDSPDLLQVQEDELGRQVAKFGTMLSAAALGVDGAVVMGSPARRIIEIADSLNAAYIVVGTQGLSGFDRLLLGSVAEAVIRKSDRPVIVVGPEAARRAAHTIPWKRLILACDPAHGVTEAARLAGNIAVTHNARLTIFNVLEDGIEQPSSAQFEAMEKMMSREAWLTVLPHCLLRAGEPTKEITRMAEDVQADLLIMSARRGGELPTHLRAGVLAKVLRVARCPAMILREAAKPSQGNEIEASPYAAIF